jgi:hypothetical protein
VQTEKEKKVKKSEDFPISSDPRGPSGKNPLAYEPH